MKKLITKSKSILKSQKGETLAEGIASLFIFSILMLGVTVMIVTSLRISGHATAEAKGLQEVVNSATEESEKDYAKSDPTTLKEYGMTFTDPDSILKDTTHKLEVFSKNGIIAFKPVKPGVTP